MIKFLKDEIGTVQEVSVETLKELFPKFAEASEEVQKRSNKWITVLTGKRDEDNLTYQVAIQDVVALQNVLYHVFIFNDKDELLTHLPVQAAKALPPVSEKTKGLDYFDYLEIQGAILNWLTENKYKPFEIDVDPAGKVVYGTKESPDEVLEKLKKNEQYGIIAMPAEIFFAKIKELQEKEAAAKSSIIVPDKTIITPDSEPAKEFKGLIIP